MAEALAALGVVASVAQLADYGFKLSVRLFAYAEAVSKADKSIRSLSNDVSLTSAVLKELGNILSNDKHNYVSDRAIEATQKTVQECLSVFEQLNQVIEKYMGDSANVVKGNDNGKLKPLDKFKWPFSQPKITLLQSNLEKLKASLTLMLQVLSFARDISDSKEAAASASLQRQIIETLARSEKEATRRYEQLLQQVSSPGLNLHHTGISPPPPYVQGMVIVGEPTTVRPLPDTKQSIEATTGELMLCMKVMQRKLSECLQHNPVVTMDRHGTLIGALDIALVLEAGHLFSKYNLAATPIKQTITSDALNLYASVSDITSKYDEQFAKLHAAHSSVTPIAQATSSTLRSERVESSPAITYRPTAAVPYDDSTQTRTGLDFLIMEEALERREKNARRSSGKLAQLSSSSQVEAILNPGAMRHSSESVADQNDEGDSMFDFDSYTQSGRNARPTVDNENDDEEASEDDAESYRREEDFRQFELKAAAARAREEKAKRRLLAKKKKEAQVLAENDSLVVDELLAEWTNLKYFKSQDHAHEQEEVAHELRQPGTWKPHDTIPENDQIEALEVPGKFPTDTLDHNLGLP